MVINFITGLPNSVTEKTKILLIITNRLNEGIFLIPINPKLFNAE